MRNRKTTAKSLQRAAIAEEKRNWIQKALQEFPTEDCAMEALCSWAEKCGYGFCRVCGSTNVERRYGSRILLCKGCNQISSITTGTLFQGIREARYWMVAIWLIGKGITVSSSMFHKYVGIAQSTALTIFKKLMMVVENEMVEKVEHTSELYSGLFTSFFSRRTRETPAREHPNAEQDVADREQDGRTAGEKMDGADFEDSGCSAHERQHNFDSDSFELDSFDLSSFDLSSFDLSSFDLSSFDLDSGTQSTSGSIRSEMDNGDFAEQSSGWNSTPISGLEDEVMAALSDRPRHIDDLCHSLGISAAEISAQLMVLVISGAVMQLPGNLYCRGEDGGASKIGGTPAGVDRTGQGSSSRPGAGSGTGDGLRSGAGSGTGDGLRPGAGSGPRDESNQTDERYSKASRRERSFLERFGDFVELNFGGLGRKYLQLYIASFWCKRDRKNWNMESLLSSCLRSKPIYYEEILAYVSPYMVQIVFEDSHCFGIEAVT